MRDFYYILGLDANCTLDEIKEAYRKLSKKYQLDLNHDYEYFKNRFREINEAYETLSDPGKRLQYDKALKKAKSNPINQEFKRRQNSREQAEHQPYQTLPSSVKRYKIKGPGIGMTLAFILLALIAVIYLAKSLGNSKIHKVVNASPVSTVSYKSHKQRQKKHKLIYKSVSDSSKLNAIDTAVKPVQPVATNKSATKPMHPVAINKPAAKPVQPVPINKPDIADNKKQPATVVHTSTGNKRQFLYATFVKANVTRVVNMRKFANYNSPVIKVIPDNSKVLVMEKGHIYNKVSYNNLVGYVPKWLLQTKRTKINRI